jgi:hypothetical protein
MSITLASLATKFLERSELGHNTRRSYEITLLPLLKKYGYTLVTHLTRQKILINPQT